MEVDAADMDGECTCLFSHGEIFRVGIGKWAGDKADICSWPLEEDGRLMLEGMGGYSTRGGLLNDLLLLEWGSTMRLPMKMRGVERCMAIGGSNTPGTILRRVIEARIITRLSLDSPVVLTCASR